MVWEFENNESQGLKALCNIRNTIYTSSYDRIQPENINLNQFLKGFVIGDKSLPEAGLILYKSGLLMDNKQVLLFGYFDSLNFNSGTSILDYVINYCKLNYPDTFLIGPVNSSTWDNYRLPVDVFKSLFPGDMAGQDFYPEMLNQLGFDVYCKYSTHIQTELNRVYSNEINGFRIVYLSKSEIISRLNEIYDLSMDAFKTAPLFQTIQFNLFEAKYKQSLIQLDTSFLPFVLDSNNKIVAYLLAYPSYEQHTLVVKTLARKSGRQFAGLGKLLANEIVNKAIDLGYKRIFHAFMNQSNVSNILSRNIAGMPCKSYAVYQYKL